MRSAYLLLSVSQSESKQDAQLTLFQAEKVMGKMFLFVFTLSKKKKKKKASFSVFWIIISKQKLKSLKSKLNLENGNNKV